MRSSSFTTSTSTTPTPPNAITRGGSPRADDADSRSSSHSDSEGGQKPSLTTKVATTPSLPELVPPNPNAHLMSKTAGLVDILLRSPNSEAKEVGRSLANILKRCQRDGVSAESLQKIQDICLMLSGLAWGRDGIGLGDAEHQKFETLVDEVFNASNRPEATQGDDSSASRSEKSDAESSPKKRMKRKVRSGEAPGSEGAEKKKSKTSGIAISTPKLTSPYPSKPPSTTATTGNSSTTTTTTTTTTTASTSFGASSSHSASTDSPPVSPRPGFSIAELVSGAKPTGDSASLLGRIAKNLSTFATQFETLVEFGHAIDRSNWSAIQQAQEIVKSLLETAGEPTSQLGWANELGKLNGAITALNKALQSAEKNARDVNHRDFDKAEFKKHANAMTRGLKKIQEKVSELQSLTEQPMSPRSTSGASPADAVSRVRSQSGGAKAHPSLSTFGRKAGKSILPNANDAPNSPRSPRRSMLGSVPAPSLKSNIQGASTTTTTTSLFGAPPPRPIAPLPAAPLAVPFAAPLLTPSMPLAPPTSPRVALPPQRQPERLRPARAPGTNAGAADQSIAKLKFALGKYSMRNLMQSVAVEGNSVVPTGQASSTVSTASSAVAAVQASSVDGNAGEPMHELRSLLSTPSARSLLQRFRVEGDSVVANAEAPTPTTVATLPTEASGALSDDDVAELLQKLEDGNDDLLKDMIDLLEGATHEPETEQSIDDTVILSSSSDDSENVRHDGDAADA